MSHQGRCSANSVLVLTCILFCSQFNLRSLKQKLLQLVKLQAGISTFKAGQRGKSSRLGIPLCSIMIHRCIMLQLLISLATTAVLLLQALRFTAAETIRSNYRKVETISFAASPATVMGA
ncbi:hypothetical protein PTKIN_Ptkin12aG0100300 [Pterospermum kingtungense]